MQCIKLGIESSFFGKPGQNLSAQGGEVRQVKTFCAGGVGISGLGVLSARAPDRVADKYDDRDESECSGDAEAEVGVVGHLVVRRSGAVDRGVAVGKLLSLVVVLGVEN